MGKKMKNGFLWGNSVSSMQTEGAWNEGGKEMSVYDIKESSEFASDWKVATDSYHRYTEDFDMMQELGMNCYRFQISWSRVVPDGDGAFNEEGIAFYDRFIDDLLKRGIEPMICLYHFDMPLALAEKYNGFLDRHVVDAFVRFGKEMMRRFASKVKYWIPFNEQNCFAMEGHAFTNSGYLKGDKTVRELYTIQHNCMMSHTYLAVEMHEKYPDCQMGGMVAYAEIYPASSKPKDVFLARKVDEFLNMNYYDLFIYGRYSPEVWQYMKNNDLTSVVLPGDEDILKKTHCDFIAFSYYASHMINTDLIDDTVIPNYISTQADENNPHLKATEWNWQIDPLGFRDIFSKLYNRYYLPLFPIENGIGVIEEWDGQNEIQDDYRIEYHREHIQAMEDAITEDGVDVMGYLGWGLVDILSSQGDMRKRYGVVYVNRENHDLKDLKRLKKKSFHWMQKVIRTNGEDLT